MMIPLILGFALDLILGEINSLPNPVRLMRKMVLYFEENLPAKIKNEKKAGEYLVVIMAAAWYVIPALILFILYKINFILGCFVEGICCYYLISAKGLQDESMKVYHSLSVYDMDSARFSASMIVKGDTDRLDANGLARATVETIADNTSESVAAPMLFMMIGGAPLAFLYKAVNTAASIVGYKNGRFNDFGKSISKTDSILSFLPSRITAVIMILSSFIIRLNGKGAYSIWKRDRKKNPDKNTSQTESVCAGALDIMLSGDAYFFGELVSRPTVGDDLREVEFEDIKHTNALMYCTAVITLGFTCVLRSILFGWMI